MLRMERLCDVVFQHESWGVCKRKTGSSVATDISVVVLANVLVPG